MLFEVKAWVRAREARARERRLGRLLDRRDGGTLGAAAERGALRHRARAASQREATPEGGSQDNPSEEAIFEAGSGTVRFAGRLLWVARASCQ